MSIVGPLESERLCWVVQPLIDAGLSPDEIEELVVHLAFDAIVTDARGAPAPLDGPVRSRSARVRTAWVQMIERMVSLEVPAE